MAVNVVFPFLIPLEESIYNATRLLTEQSPSKVLFEKSKQCILSFEDTTPGTNIIKVAAKHFENRKIWYSIAKGNEDGLFSMDAETGQISLAAYMDHEVNQKHKLVVEAHSEDQHKAETIVIIRVADVNDNIPEFVASDLEVQVTEEESDKLPRVIGRVWATDRDWIDEVGLLYTLVGDGIDGYTAKSAYFAVNPRTGEVSLLKALDRDPPTGKSIWKLKVKVHDGQIDWLRKRLRLANSINSSRIKRDTKTRKFYVTTDNNGKYFSNNLSNSDNIIFHKREVNKKGRLSKNGRLSETKKTIRTRKIRQKRKDKYLTSVPTESFKSLTQIPDFKNKTKSDRMLIFEKRSIRHSKMSSINLRQHGDPSRRSIYGNFVSNSTELQDDEARPINYTKMSEHHETAQKSSMEADANIKDHQIMSNNIKSSFKQSFLGSHRNVQFFHKNDYTWRRLNLFQDISQGKEINDDCDILEDVNMILDNEQQHRLRLLVANAIKISDSRKGDVHVVEALVRVIVKDINDNSPLFPNATIHGTVQENGPSDLPVTVVNAWDADDPGEGSNAILTYFLEKNAVDEHNGKPIFKINKGTGEIRTNLCCLDRESTWQYHLEVVAVDGGGLKGTGTVAVRLSDENDNSPLFTRREWKVVINETINDIDNRTLFEITASDPDTSNDFYFRIVEYSGWGWDYFQIRTKGFVGEVSAVKSLDYEDERQRNGFKFLVAVTDRGLSGLSSDAIDSAWVNVQLQDLNDNAPVFEKDHIHLTISENTPAHARIAQFNVMDPDMIDEDFLKLTLVGVNKNYLTIDKHGVVSTMELLDREVLGSEPWATRVVAVDKGTPPRSATGVLEITITDINDTPPKIITPTVFNIMENEPAAKVGIVLATDDDVWALGHGPPFTFEMSNMNPPEIFKQFHLRFRKEMDSGRGGAELWTKVPLDREKAKDYVIKITLTDIMGLNDTQEIKVIANDVNDNDMKPGFKNIYVWKTEGAASDSAIGHIFVNDPDDWDTNDKTFEWNDTPHPLFSLDKSSGTIYASKLIAEGRFDLYFKVSDVVRQQNNVPSNVTVEVIYLPEDFLSVSIPMHVVGMSPNELTKNWTPGTTSGHMGKLINCLQNTFHEFTSSINVVSVARGTAEEISTLSGQSNSQSTSATVWLSAKGRTGEQMKVSYFRGVLELQNDHIEKQLGMQLRFDIPYENFHSVDRHTNWSQNRQDQQYFETLPLKPLSFQVIDTNETSIVTPKLTRPYLCQAVLHDSQDFFQAKTMEKLLKVDCKTIGCFNGGRCIPTETGSKCVCPGYTYGPLCKSVFKYFDGNTYLWLPSLPRCFPLDIAFGFRASKSDGLILYSGPVAKQHFYSWQSDLHTSFKNQSRLSRKVIPMMTVQLKNGRLEIIFESSMTQILVILGSNLSDGNGHHVRFTVTHKGYHAMLDHCVEKYNSTSDCKADGSWKENDENVEWLVPWQPYLPLQIGGLSHQVPKPKENGWVNRPADIFYRGCISRLMINHELANLVHPFVDQRSNDEDSRCIENFPMLSSFTPALASEVKTCPKNTNTSQCSEKIDFVSIEEGVSKKVPLIFTPDPIELHISVKFKTMRLTGSVLKVSSRVDPTFFQIYILNGNVCLSFSEAGLPLHKVPDHQETFISKTAELIKQRLSRINETMSMKHTQKNDLRKSICLSYVFISDGVWHILHAARLGNNLLIEVDESDGWKRNTTKINTVANTMAKKFILDTTVQLVLGDDMATKRTVHYNSGYKNKICLENLQMNGIALSLSSLGDSEVIGNTSTSAKNKCEMPFICRPENCNLPMACRDIHGIQTCSCPLGHTPVGNACHRYETCSYHPCLNGGQCISSEDRISCLCNENFEGEYCQWNTSNDNIFAMSPILLSGLLFLSVLTLAFCVILGCKRYNTHKRKRRKSHNDNFSEEKISVEPYDTDKSQSICCLEKTYDSLKKQPPCTIPKGKNAKSISQSIFESFSRVENLQGSFCHEDLRAYAYEGDGSSSSLGSAVSGLRKELEPSLNIKVFDPNFKEALVLLNDLPNHNVSSLKKKSKSEILPNPASKRTTSSNVLHRDIAQGLPSSIGSKRNAIC